MTTPITVLTGTTITVVSSVSLTADKVSASRSAFHHAANPFEKASFTMMPSGSTRISAIVRTASVPTTT